MCKKLFGTVSVFLIFSILLGFAFLVKNNIEPSPESMVWGGIGHAKILDGDTILFKGERLRLIYIDACEMGQPMFGGSGQVDCGLFAKTALLEIVGATELQCQWSKRDHYDRPLANCKTKFNNVDLALSLVQGGAVPLSTFNRKAIPSELLLAEIEACHSKTGIWAFQFDDPNIYRKRSK